MWQNIIPGFTVRGVPSVAVLTRVKKTRDRSDRDPSLCRRQQGRSPIRPSEEFTYLCCLEIQVLPSNTSPSFEGSILDVTQ